MEYFCSEDNQTIVIRFDHGDLLLEGLQQVADELGLETAALVTGYGALSRLHVHWGKHTGRPAEAVYGVYEEPLEICALPGVIAAGQVHVHITAGAGERTISGHLEPGTVVCWLAEVVIQKLPLDLVRVKDEWGVPLLRSRESRGASRE
jgi:predicted DNA-binding protein with PD1-like motif